MRVNLETKQLELGDGSLHPVAHFVGPDGFDCHWREAVAAFSEVKGESIMVDLRRFAAHRRT